MFLVLPQIRHREPRSGVAIQAFWIASLATPPRKDGLGNGVKRLTVLEVCL